MGFADEDMVMIIILANIIYNIKIINSIMVIQFGIEGQREEKIS